MFVLKLFRYSCLHTLNHPNIVKLHGVTAGSVESAVAAGKECGYFIIIDRLYGTLEHKIHEWHDLDNEIESSYPNSGMMMLTRIFTTNTSEYKQRKKELLNERIKVAMSIADAMEYLHSLRLVYRDLKPENIGFHKDGTVKLFDFGLTKELKSNDQTLDGCNFRLTGNTVRTMTVFYVLLLLWF